MVECGLSKPREGGVYGVWIASMMLGLLTLADYRLSLAPALAGSLLALFTADPSRVRIQCVALVSLLFLPLVLERIPYSLLPLALFPVLFYSTLHGGTVKYVTGAGLVAMPGGILALASPHPYVVLLPPLYAMMAAGLAYRRIYGMSPWGLELVSGLGVAVYGLGLLLVSPLAGVVLIADLILRLVIRLLGLDLRVRLRTYGFIEAFRSLAVMVIVGLSLGPLL